MFLSRALGPHGVPVFVNDITSSALDEGREHVARRFLKTVNQGRMTAAQAKAAANNIHFTLDKSFLVGCDLVIEAVTERLEAKQSVLQELERFLPPRSILASTSSHLEPDLLFEKIRRPERALVLHHFYPPDTNPLVEVVSGPRTTVAGWCLRLYEALGKVPILAGSRYGYAVNPVFEGLFLAALLLVEEGFPPPMIDAIACRALGMAAGPFTTANLSRTGAIRQIGLREYGRKIMPWFRSPAILDEKVATRERWEAAGSGDTVSYSNAMYNSISHELMGAYFGLACEVLESGLVDLGDLERAVETGLSMKPPFSMMNELGPKRARELVEAYARKHPGFRPPRAFGPWTIPFVSREDLEDVAVVTLKRPRTLNALGIEVYRQIDRHFAEIREDRRIVAAVLTGFGTRAFSSGADLGTVASIRTPQEALRLSREAGGVLSRIAGLGKPVVCALNGLSLGAGSELAYACTARIARKGLPALFGHPEVRLGLIPGTGGSQRLPRLIDFSAAWKILRTGGTLSGAEALRLGLITEEAEGDLVEKAAALARRLQPTPLPSPRVPAPLPEVDLGTLSRKVDEILCRAVLAGMEMPIEKALEHESERFAEIFTTRDCRIGLENYLRTRLREPARFVHA